MPQSRLTTPIGHVTLLGDGHVLTTIRIDTGAVAAVPTDEDAITREAAAQIAAWFDGRLTIFDLPLAPALSPRGPAHRAAILAIGYGETASYGAVARSIGSGPRAVGQACRRNPLPIVIPCHRVLGASQALGHYSAGQGIATKRWLLNHETSRRA